ncbi:phenol hydroxylase subunit [Pseudomonas sp. DR48]|jgi:phenol hydroxylase P0 protein|uniref:phenol hydroxylase subunit n=1 Tax=Pseudomonas sp. DR48 TaxID=2871095 RepID=UPI001C99C430|nr:phenol hydroxylase subunit [Pseudomonas sp. DR48]QZP31455.1 phenol hydroxylase subunit [Pseudomonas sp. DR48]
MNSSGSTFDQMPRYVRVRSEPDDAFVEFDFAIGYPELYVELVMPHQAFKQFCEAHHVQHMDAQMSRALDADAQKWRYGETRGAEAVQDPQQ